MLVKHFDRSTGTHGWKEKDQAWPLRSTGWTANHLKPLTPEEIEVLIADNTQRAETFLRENPNTIPCWDRPWCHCIYCTHYYDSRTRFQCVIHAVRLGMFNVAWITATQSTKAWFSK